LTDCPTCGIMVLVGEGRLFTPLPQKST